MVNYLFFKYSIKLKIFNLIIFLNVLTQLFIHHLNQFLNQNHLVVHLQKSF
jgi:hypothetical protein